jgi:O-antigen ligase
LNPAPASAAAAVSTPQRIEHAILLGLALVLPLFEAPKNLLWIAYVAIWLANRVRARDLGGRWDRWDTLVALWIASGYAVAAFAGIRHEEWSAANDILRYGSILWLLRRSRYPDGTWFALLAMIVAGTVVALAWGYYGLLIEKKHQFLGLKSVGHVNHSAIYLAIVSGAALAAARAWWREMGLLGRAAGLVLLAALVVSLFWMQSRAAVGAGLVVAVVLLGVYAARTRRGLHRVIIGATVAVGVALVLRPQVVEKYEARMEEDRILAYRDQIWLVGLTALREHPWFGVGMGNFERIGPKEVRAWGEKRSESIDMTRLVFSSHAHSLYVNTLAERGLVGFTVLVAVLVAWAVALIRRIPEAHAPPLLWAYWGAAAGAWLIAAIAGSVNTTLHHEHALLSMLVLGGWLSLSQASGAATGVKAK